MYVCMYVCMCIYIYRERHKTLNPKPIDVSYMRRTALHYGLLGQLRRLAAAQANRRLPGLQTGGFFGIDLGALGLGF